MSENPTTTAEFYMGLIRVTLINVKYVLTTIYNSFNIKILNTVTFLLIRGYAYLCNHIIVLFKLLSPPPPKGFSLFFN